MGEPLPPPSKDNEEKEKKPELTPDQIKKKANEKHEKKEQRDFKELLTKIKEVQQKIEDAKLENDLKPKEMCEGEGGSCNIGATELQLYKRDLFEISKDIVQKASDKLSMGLESEYVLDANVTTSNQIINVSGYISGPSGDHKIEIEVGNGYYKVSKTTEGKTEVFDTRKS